MVDSQKGLKGLKKEHSHFVGIDSDGCAFDTMEIKQKQCFHPQIMDEWELRPIEKELRMVAEWVNLYSVHRGANRFPALKLVLELLKEMPEVKEAGVEIPDTTTLGEYIDSGLPLGNDSLKEYIKDHPEMEQFLKWSLGVNKNVERIVKGVPPFKYVRESLEKIRDKTDCIVVSATPNEALIREWEEHDLAKYVKLIAGQEMGKKKEHLQLATKGQYEENHILMIGDAPGDFRAARANNALFYPVNPGREEDSWKMFFEEGLNKFLNDEYAGDVETRLIEEFNSLLPETPHWIK